MCLAGFVSMPQAEATRGQVLTAPADHCSTQRAVRDSKGRKQPPWWDFQFCCPSPKPLLLHGRLKGSSVAWEKEGRVLSLRHPHCHQSVAVTDLLA